MVDIAKRKLGIKSLKESFKEIKAFDSTVITMTSPLAPNLYIENNLSVTKISTLLSLSQNLPEKVQIVPAKVNDKKCIDEFINDKEALYLLDRGYYNYTWYDKLTDDGYKFITRQINTAMVKEIKSTYVENDLIFDYKITLGTDYSKNKTHNSYREILTFDENEEEIRLLTNIFNVQQKKF